MSLFLVLIPKHNFDEAGHVSDVATRVAEEYGRFVGDGFPEPPSIISPIPEGHARLLTWTRSGHTPQFEVKDDFWVTTAGSEVASDLINSVTRVAGRLLYERPVWGQYSAVYAERFTQRFTAWNTVPALEAIHYGDSSDFIAISNRPLLVALALAQGYRSDVRLSDAFATEYLLYGYSMTGQTAFENVRTLHPSAALQVHRGRISFVEVPAGLQSPLPTQHSLDDAGQALKAALERATIRSLKSVGAQRLQLRMSGGKDSRLLLGLIRKQRIDKYAVTMGQPNDREVLVARELTSRARIEHRITSPALSPGDTVREKVLWTIMHSDGTPTAEAHQAIYRGAEPESPNDGLMLGQWPLMKGGLASRLRYSPDEAKAALRAQGFWHVSDEYREPFEQYLADWFDNVPAKNDVEKLYLFSREFRSGRWLQAQVSLFARDAVLAYPISDAEVTAVSDSLTMEEKVNQTVLFKAMEGIWKDAVKVPFRDSTWAFESNKKHPEISGRYYELRSKEFEPSRTSNAIHVPRKNAISEYDASVHREIANEILRSSQRDALFERVTPRTREFVESIAEGGPLNGPRGVNKRQLMVSLWRLYVADAWLSREWLEH